MFPADYTPYEGIEVTGWPVTTLVRGRLVVENGVGAFLQRRKLAFVPDWFPLPSTHYNRLS